MKLDYKIGCSSSIKEIETRFSEINNKFTHLQIFADDPQTFNISTETIQFLKRFGKEFKLIIHSPFIVNLVNIEHKTFKPSVSFSNSIAELGEMGLYGYVSHLGKIFTKAQFDSGVTKSIYYGSDSLSRFLDMVIPSFERNKVILFLENTVGTDFNSDLGNTNFLISKIREYNSPNLKLCWDLEHSYASGEVTIEHADQMYQNGNNIGLVHMNAIEKGVEFGKHLDRHSLTCLDECTKFLPSKYLNFYDKFKNVPIIFERENIDLALQDLNFLLTRVWRTPK